VHPAIESLAWGHVIGKPADQLRLSADVTMNQKLDQERELSNRLSVEQLESLASESQALLDRAMEMARANAGTGAASAPRALAEHGMSSDALGPTYFGTDVARTGKADPPFAPDGAHSRRTLVLVDSPSPAAAVGDVVMGERVEPSTTAAVSDDQDAASGDTVPPEGR
jgi:hypothetical protein